MTILDTIIAQKRVEVAALRPRAAALFIAEMML